MKLELTLVLYDFSGSAWCQVPKLAIEELGLQNDVEYKAINLVEVSDGWRGLAGEDA